MSEVKPVLYLGTKLVPYEERTFRIADLRDAMGYTHDHKQFYSEEQVQKLLAENERLRAEVAEWKAIATWEKEQHDRLFKEARALNERAERLEVALRGAAEFLVKKGFASEAEYFLAHAALDQEGGNE